MKYLPVEQSKLQISFAKLIFIPLPCSISTFSAALYIRVRKHFLLSSATLARVHHTLSFNRTHVIYSGKPGHRGEKVVARGFCHASEVEIKW
jgi:hypothetical protein